MYKLIYTHQFKKSLRLCQRRGFDMNAIKRVLELLERDGVLPPEYKPHVLSGNYANFWECHIKSDWLLLWKQIDDEFILLITDTGTHSDLF